MRVIGVNSDIAQVTRVHMFMYIKSCTTNYFNRIYVMHHYQTVNISHTNTKHIYIKLGKKRSFK